jgi:hypothetical protein
VQVSIAREALGANDDCLHPGAGVARCEKIDDRACRQEDSAGLTPMEVVDMDGLEIGSVPPLSTRA